jgi:AraC-like DNA-binding protein
MSAADVVLRECQYGRYDHYADGWVHTKTIPQTIVGQTLHGRFEVWCEGQHVLIQPGEFFVVGPMQPVSIAHYFGDEDHMAGRWVHLRLERFAEVDALAAYHLPLRISAQAGEPISRAMDALAALGADDAGLAWQIAWRQQAYAILDRLLQLSSPRAGQPDLGGLAPLFDMVDRHLHETLGVAEMAASLHLSEPRFHVVFKQRMGRSPKAWLQEVRLQRAARALLVEEASIQTIAERCGFPNPFHFSRCFKQWSGQAPRAWREQHRAGLL